MVVVSSLLLALGVSGAAAGDRTPASLLITNSPSVIPLGNGMSEELFVNVQITYWGAAPEFISVKSFLLTVNDSPRAYEAQPYDAPDALQSTNVISATGTLTGTLLFIVPGTTRLVHLGVELAHNRFTSLASASITPFTASPTRLYGTQSQPALEQYLLDEAAASGAVRLQLLSGSGLSPAEFAALRAQLASVQQRLKSDHDAFDVRQPGGTGDARQLHDAADRIFSRIESDLGAAPLSSAAYTDWASWYGAFSIDDRALANLYQAWPGPR